jgi:hypothetical protein
MAIVETIEVDGKKYIKNQDTQEWVLVDQTLPPMPQDGKIYRWDETTVSWVAE